MRYKQSLMEYCRKNGVGKASRKCNRARPYIYFWRNRYDGTLESLQPKSKRPHQHPNEHTQAEPKPIRDMRRRNPDLGITGLWHRLRKRGYTRCPESLLRVLRRLGLMKTEKAKKKCIPKPYEQTMRPGERIQIDVKVVPRSCVSDPRERLFQYTAIDEYTRLGYLDAYPEPTRLRTSYKM